MVRVRLVWSSYLAYFYLEYLQPVKAILSGGQVLKSLQNVDGKNISIGTS